MLFGLILFADPFSEANVEDSGVGSKGSGYVHVRVQQRNGRKSLTTVQGLKKEFNYNKILKDLKKEFCCNGVVVQDPELGQVIQLQGDQRKNVSNFLVQVCDYAVFELLFGTISTWLSHEVSCFQKWLFRGKPVFYVNVRVNL